MSAAHKSLARPIFKPWAVWQLPHALFYKHVQSRQASYWVHEVASVTGYWQ